MVVDRSEAQYKEATVDLVRQPEPSPSEQACVVPSDVKTQTVQQLTEERKAGCDNSELVQNARRIRA